MNMNIAGLFEGGSISMPHCRHHSVEISLVAFLNVQMSGENDLI